MTHKIIRTLVAAAFGTVAMTGVAQTTAPAQNDASRAQTNTAQDRLPAAKVDSSGTQSSTSTTPNADQPNAARAKHPPTSIMDRATPTMTAPNKQSDRKHPPTSVMDSATPQEKSPATNESQSSTQTPAK